MKKEINSFMDYLSRSVSPYHGVAETIRLLEEEGFTKLPLNGDWQLQKGGRYVVEGGFSTMTAAFTVGESFAPADGFNIAACHMDWPCFYIKPDPEEKAGGCLKLAVEPYGGLILNTWMDRPLSCAGLVTLKGDKPLSPKRVLFNFDKPLFTIPNLAIHMNRTVNKGVELNPAKDMLPLCDTVEKEFNKDGYFIGKVAEALQVEKEDILFFDLALYNAEAPQLLGFNGELLSSPRLDNLTSAFACLAGITGPQRKKGVNIAAFFDHEEIGSRSKAGAGGSTLSFITEKIACALGLDRSGYLNALLSGFLLSCDVAHALHPDRLEVYDPVVNSRMNGGVTVKMNYEQRYATEAAGIGMVESLCKAKGIPCQRFMNKADTRGGSTLGSFASSTMSISAVDIGVPILAMHSSRELMGVKDQDAINDLVSAFFEEER